MMEHNYVNDLAGEKTVHWQITRTADVGPGGETCGGAGNTRQQYLIATRAGGQTWRLGFKEALFTPEAINNSGLVELELRLNNETDLKIPMGKTWRWYFEEN